MIKHKVKHLMKFVGFTFTIWILCIAYAFTSLGDKKDR